MADFSITPYEPPAEPFKLDIHAFWLIPDPDRPGKNRTIPIPHEEFMAYLDALDG